MYVCDMYVCVLLVSTAATICAATRAAGTAPCPSAAFDLGVSDSLAEGEQERKKKEKVFVMYGVSFSVSTIAGKDQARDGTSPGE